MLLANVLVLVSNLFHSLLSLINLLTGIMLVLAFAECCSCL